MVTDGWEKIVQTEAWIAVGAAKNFWQTVENIAKHTSSVGGSLDAALGSTFALSPTRTQAPEVEHDVDDLQH